MNYNIPLILEFVYNRLLNVHNENSNLDWMGEFKSSIEHVKSIPKDYQNLLNIINEQNKIIHIQEQLMEIFQKNNNNKEKLINLYKDLYDKLKELNLEKANYGDLLVNTYLKSKINYTV